MKWQQLKKNIDREISIHVELKRIKIRSIISKQ